MKLVSAVKSSAVQLRQHPVLRDHVPEAGFRRPAERHGIAFGEL